MDPLFWFYCVGLKCETFFRRVFLSSGTWQIEAASNVARNALNSLITMTKSFFLFFVFCYLTSTSLKINRRRVRWNHLRLFPHWCRVRLFRTNPVMFLCYPLNLSKGKIFQNKKRLLISGTAKTHLPFCRYIIPPVNTTNLFRFFDACLKIMTLIFFLKYDSFKGLKPSAGWKTIAWYSWNDEKKLTNDTQVSSYKFSLHPLWILMLGNKCLRWEGAASRCGTFSASSFKDRWRSLTSSFFVFFFFIYTTIFFITF